jgi:phenylacetate-CoA ligase
MMTPGYDSSAIFEILRDLSSFYDQIIITGHTPFLKELVEQAPEEKINLKELNLVFLGTGQGITEDWRKYIVGKLGSNDFYHTFINLYGSADAELMGFETPTSIYIRKNASKYSKKQKENFGQNRLPSIYQYDPRITYFEESGGELLITKYSISPLIRYNIHDEGGLFGWDDMLKSFNIKNIGVLLKNNLKYKTAKFPFVYIFGRDKFMVKIYGANVFTEHVQSVFDNAKLRELFTGRFKMEINYNYINNPVMVCHAELTSRVKTGISEYKKLLKITFVKEVARLNSEYKFVLNRMGKKVIPEIKLYSYGDESIFPKNKTRKTA